VRAPARKAVEPSGEPPVQVRSVVEQRFGVDLSKVQVRRGPKAERATREAQARAVTVDEVVHIPAALGPIDTKRARPLLVHELVHVAQQRRLAPRRPDERSDEGKALEAEARLIEGQERKKAETEPPQISSASAASRPEPARPQTPVRAAAPPEPSSAPGPGVQRAAETPAAAAPSGEPTLDQVASRLYEQLSRQLRRELLVDRERAGLLTDR
jgi:hypothetical protein